MGASKTSSYTASQINIAQMAKALGHPARIAILEYLLSVNKCICKDIVEELPLSQSTISQHLRELKSAEIIQGDVEGTAICYCINKTKIEDLSNYCSSIISKLNINCC